MSVSESKGKWLIVATFLTVHVPILFFVLSNPQSMMAGDRSKSRLGRINQVFFDESTTLREFFALGDPGDYLFHGVLISLGGPTLLFVAQLVFLAVATYYVFHLARWLGLRSEYATLATVLYIVLPSIAIHPHTLATEGFYNPLLIIGTALIVKSIELRDSSRSLYWGALCLAMAVMIRSQLLLYPLLLSAMLLMARKEVRPHQALAILPICFAFPMVWAAMSYLVLGEYQLGSQSSSLSLNLFQTVERLSVVGSLDIDLSSYDSGEMSIGQFAAIAASHPVAFFQLKFTELFNLLFNPGAYSILVRFFEVYDPAGDSSHWAAVRDEVGLVGMFSQLLRLHFGMAAAVIGGGLIWFGIMLGAVIGAVNFLRGNQPKVVTKGIVLSLFIYSILIVLISAGTRWGQRSSVDFIIVILFVLGLQNVVAVRRLSRKSPAAKAALQSDSS